MQNEIQFLSLDESKIESVKKFADNYIGENYYSSSDLLQILKQAQKNNLNASLLAYLSDQLIGIRLTLAPGQWDLKNSKINPQLWNVDSTLVGYFKSLFVHPDFQNKKIGSTLSHKSEMILKQMDAQAIVTHSWLESPSNSSQIYLHNFGFKEVARHPLFWNNIDYKCTRCGPKKCECTGIEMIKYI